MSLPACSNTQPLPEPFRPRQRRTFHCRPGRRMAGGATARQLRQRRRVLMMHRLCRLGRKSRRSSLSHTAGLMLRGLRKASSNWVGKTIMGAVVAFLIGSFAIWGIGDIFRGFGLATAAKIGRTELTTDQFRQIYNDRLQRLGRQFGRPITPDQARALGLDRQILRRSPPRSRSTSGRAHWGSGSPMSRSRAGSGQPGVPDAQRPVRFQQFQQIIRQAGFTEQRFIAEQRQNALRGQLSGTVTTGTVVPNAVIELADRYQNEQRSIDYVLLDHAQAGDIPTPTPEALRSISMIARSSIARPEYRKVVVLALIPSELANTVEVSDEDAKKAYDEHRRPIRHARASAAAADRVSQRRRRSAPPPKRSPRAQALPMKPRNTASTWYRSRDADQGRHHRSGTGRCRLRAQAGETSAPVKGRFGTAAHQRRQGRARQQYSSFEEVAAEVKKTSPPSVPKRGFCRATTRSRTSVRKVTRWPRPQWPSS